jgi:hypothetical protein
MDAPRDHSEHEVAPAAKSESWHMQTLGHAAEQVSLERGLGFLEATSSDRHLSSSIAGSAHLGKGFHA